MEKIVNRNILKINNNEGLKINSLVKLKLNKLYRLDTVTIIYFNNLLNKKIKIFNDDIQEALNVLISITTKALQGKLVLHSTIDNIGLMWTKNYLSNKYDENYVISTEDNRWIGLKYHIWSTKNKTTWLYQKSDKFYIEITPVFNSSLYKDYSVKKKYKRFIANYKPYITTEISIAQLNQWLNYAIQLLKKIESNDAEYLAGYYKDNKSESYCNLLE